MGTGPGLEMPDRVIDERDHDEIEVDVPHRRRLACSAARRRAPARVFEEPQSRR